MARAALFAALLLAAACDEPEPRETATSADEPTEPAGRVDESEEPEEREERDDGCGLSESETWLEDAPPRGTIALRQGGEDGGGMLAVADAGGGVRVRRLGSRAPTGPAQTLALGGATALFALEPVGEGYVLLARGSCPESAHCLLAQRLDARGSPTGPSIAAALPGPLRTARRVTAGDRLYVAWSAEGGHRGLDLFPALGDSLGRARRPLGTEPASEELPTEILGLAAGEDGWVAVWRRGAPEDARGRVFVTTEGASVALEALHEVLVVDAIAFDGDEVALVAGFEFSRPHFLRIAPGADEPADAREIPAGESPPAPFANRVRAALEVDDGGLWLRRTNAAGDPLGEPVRVATEHVGAATVARAGEGFAVAWIDTEEHAVRARRVACDAPER